MRKCEFCAIYSVTDISTTTKLLYYTSDNISSMEIDGSKVNISTSYQFSTTGFHYVKYKLKDITIIEDRTFADCDKLIRITITDSVTSIGNGAFMGTSCSSITYTGTMEQWNTISLGAGWTDMLMSVQCTDGRIYTR